MSQEQETALQILRTSSKISTPEQLAVVLKTEPRYYSLEYGQRLAWLGQQILTLNYMVHSQKTPNEFDLVVESSTLDQAIMDDEGVRGLTQIEMQEAFRRGISREYGDYFGITTPSLIGFLRSYKTSEKRMKAIALLYQEEKKKVEKEDLLFWQTLKRAREEYGLEFPDFAHNPFEDDKQHITRIRKQRAEILKKMSDEKD